MILIDANVFMYAGGRPHPHKAPSLALLRRLAAGEVEGAVDAEALQEILHRYRSLGRWKEGRSVYDTARGVASAVIPITVEVLDAARAMMDLHPRLTTRDAVHAAVCRLHEMEAICSYDRDFDGLAGLTRREPDGV